MKILFVCPNYHPAHRFGGPIRSVHALAKALYALGNDVAVFTTNSNGPQDLDVPVGIATPIDGVKVTYFQVRWPRAYFRSPDLKKALHESVASFDLVYAPWLYSYTTTVAGWESARARIPYVLSPRGMLDRNAIARKGRVKKWAYLAAIAAPLLRRAAGVHFTSSGERDNSILAVAPQDAIVVPNGIEMDRAGDVGDCKAALQQLGIPANKRIVLFLGRLSHIKGLDLLVAAWPAVQRAVPSAHLVLAGPDDENLRCSLEKQLATAVAMGSVSFVGAVDGVPKSCLLRDCSFLVSPSYLESFGMSIVEAMAAGKPVIVTDMVNIWPEIAEAGAGTVIPCSSSDLAHAIITLLQDEGKTSRMGIAARALVARSYELQATARNMQAAFESVLTRARQNRSGS